MTRILTILAAVAAGLLGLVPAQAGDNWHDQIIDASKLAEKQVAQKSIRVASLGNTEINTEGRRARSHRGKSSDGEERRTKRHTRVASLGRTKSDGDSDRPQRRRSLSGGSVNWTADSGCLDSTLRGIMHSLASNYGPVTVNSTCRSRSHNASVGGAPKSYHLRGEAVDFRVHGNASAVYASLRNNGNVGGLKHYGGGLFHIDTGPRRSW